MKPSVIVAALLLTSTAFSASSSVKSKSLLRNPIKNLGKAVKGLLMPSTVAKKSPVTQPAFEEPESDGEESLFFHSDLLGNDEFDVYDHLMQGQLKRDPKKVNPDIFYPWIKTAITRKTELSPAVKAAVVNILTADLEESDEKLDKLEHKLKSLNRDDPELARYQQSSIKFHLLKVEQEIRDLETCLMMLKGNESEMPQ